MDAGGIMTQVWENVPKWVQSNPTILTSTHTSIRNSTHRRVPTRAQRWTEGRRLHNNHCHSVLFVIFISNSIFETSESMTSYESKYSIHGKYQTTKKCTGYGKGKLSHVREGGGFPLIWNLFCWRKIGREWGGQVPPLRPIPWRSLTNCQWWLLVGQNGIRQNSRWFVVILSGPFCCHLAFSSSSSLHLISSFHILIIILILYAKFLVLFCYNIIAERMGL